MPSPTSRKPMLPSTGAWLCPGIGVMQHLPVLRGKQPRGSHARRSSCTLHIPWDGFSIH